MLWLVVKVKQAIENLRVVGKYYRKWGFAKKDLRLAMLYAMRSPYKVSKDFLVARGKRDVHVYGETPLTTMAKIIKECGVKEGDRLYELGCGTGRTCLWLREFVGCEVVGVERIPTFVRNARKVLTDVEFRQEDFFAQDYGDADVVYLYGSCMDELEADRMSQALQGMRAGARVISVSFPLDGFKVLKKFNARFIWGKAEVFLQVRIPEQLV
jgi:SAM-dependent methyltransferase